MSEHVIPGDLNLFLAVRDHASGRAQMRMAEAADLHELKGKALGCWCAPQPCHGDVLAELADAIVAAPEAPDVR